MTAQEARQTTNLARLKKICTPDGDTVYFGLMKRVSTASAQGDSMVKATIMTRHAREIEARLANDKFTCKHWSIDDHSVSIIHIEW